jgi:hypothetical protein
VLAFSRTQYANKNFLLENQGLTRRKEERFLIGGETKGMCLFQLRDK